MAYALGITPNFELIRRELYVKSRKDLVRLKNKLKRKTTPFQLGTAAAEECSTATAPAPGRNGAFKLKSAQVLMVPTRAKLEILVRDLKT
jgi:hypothetical protein